MLKLIKFGSPLNPPRGKLIVFYIFDLLSLIVVLHLCSIGTYRL
jgi:hypothetical protein